MVPRAEGASVVVPSPVGPLAIEACAGAITPAGTVFQRTVWEALTQIGYGETVSYGQLARRIDRPSAVRAVGAANGRNPIPIVIPCHRVIGGDGRLVGFGGGVEVKKYLLGLEQGSLF
jgi:methylated-DNA-[protein]-cysteine S-methyltransferase